MEVRAGACYRLEEPKPSLAFRVFELGPAKGTPCLCITRQIPERVRIEHCIVASPCIWLSEVSGPGHHSGNALAGLAKHVEEVAVARTQRPPVLLDGVEYLVENNGFEAGLSFVEHLNEFVMARQATLVIPVSQKALSPRETARLERYVQVPSATAWLDELSREKLTERLDRGV